MPQDALQSVLTEAGLAIAPLRAINTPEKGVAFFKQLGFNFPPNSFGGALPGIASQGSELLTAVQQLVNASGDQQVIAALGNIFIRLGGTINAIKDLQTQIQSGAGAGLPNIGEFALRLTDFMILDYLDKQRPQAHAALLLLGLVEHEPTPAAGQSMRKVNWDRMGKLFSEPQQLFNTVYSWDSNFDAAKFLARLERLMRAGNLPGGLYPEADTTKTLLGNTGAGNQELRFPLFQKGLTPETYAQFGITFAAAEQLNAEKKKGIAMLPYLMGTASFQFDVCDKGELVFESTADIKGVGVIIRPPFKAEGVLNAVANFHSSVAIRQKAAQTEEVILIGSAGGTRLAVQGLGVKWFMENPQQKINVGMEGEIQALRLVVKGGDGDGFLQKILSAINLEAEANLAFGISLLNGFTLRGGAKFAIELPVHINLGPLSIEGLRIGIEPKSDKLQVEAGAVFKLSLGPLKAVVENIGLRADLKFQQGNLGPAQLDIGFKPPNGVGLSIDAGVVKGGGYLFFDFDNEEYAGALELTFSNIVSLKAIGIITTRMPDGSKGFSLLLIITAEFGTGLQLGYGFVLLGVGGLLGLNRTMRLQPLAEGVRTGGINGIMFPTNVVENAPRIISDLRNYFPPQEGVFLIGPMAKLGWGTPALITVSLGIIIEIPGNIAILGVLKVVLPTEEEALLKLQINFIGAIEFDKKRLWFFASLYDSRILFITLEGEMGLLVAWGDDANFVVSVGGFHPAFNPPPLPFGSIARLSLNLLNESWGRIRVMCYFAVTSNTVQFGARAELYFGISAFNIDGHIQFDALFQFSPFMFIIELSASLSVKVFGIGLFSVRISMTLEGPTPYRARGTGSISLLFFDIETDFDFTWGESKDTTLLPKAVMPDLVIEVNKLENWKALLPAGNNILVTIRKIDATTELVLHPVGSLQISQRYVPLGININKIGAQKISDAQKFSINVVDTSGLARKDAVMESFAMAQFQEMSGADKLSKASFEKEEGGIELSVSGKHTSTGRIVKRVVRYELIVIDTNYKRFTKKLVNFFSGTLFLHLLKGNAIAKSELSAATKKKLQPFEEKIEFKQTEYAVASILDNTDVGGKKFASEAQAREFLRQQVKANGALKESLHVLPDYELNKA